MEPEWAFDGHFPVTECLVREDFRLWRLLEVQEGPTDAINILWGEFAVLLTQVLAKRLVPPRSIDELNLATPMDRLLVREHPNVGRNAGVVEKVERQGDDGFEPIVLDNPTPYIALPLACIPGKE